MHQDASTGVGASLREDHWESSARGPRGWGGGLAPLTSSGAPSYFLKRSGHKEHLKIGTPITVGGYNVLTSTHDGDLDALSVFERELSASGKHRYWVRRVDNVARAIAKAHVMGACEITRFMRDDVLERNPHLAASDLVVKPGNYDGSTVFYDRARFVLEDQRSVVLTPPKTQLALACLLRDRKAGSGVRFWIVVLHLKSDGGGANGSQESVRVSQAHAAIRFLRTLEDHPCIIVGDLNSDAFLCNGWLASQRPHVKQVLEGAGFESILPLVPTYLHFDRCCFDYILGRNISPLSWHVPTAKGPCPNATQGSDHLPVYADLIVWH